MLCCPGCLSYERALKEVRCHLVNEHGQRRASGCPMSSKAHKPICNLEVGITNQHGQTCLTGTATSYTGALPLVEISRLSQVE
jgi:hypothetical protein